MFKGHLNLSLILMLISSLQLGKCANYHRKSLMWLKWLILAGTEKHGYILHHPSPHPHPTPSTTTPRLYLKHSNVKTMLSKIVQHQFASTRNLYTIAPWWTLHYKLLELNVISNVITLPTNSTNTTWKPSSGKHITNSYWFKAGFHADVTGDTKLYATMLILFREHIL